VSDWSEERLYVLNMIEDLKAEQRRQAEAAAAARAKLEEKAQRDAERAEKDMHAAHDKIRALEQSGAGLRLKNWLMTLALSGAGAIAFELAKAWLAKH
jgi:hypothetical protein